MVPQSQQDRTCQGIRTQKMKETINTDCEPIEEELPDGRLYSQRLLQQNILCVKTWAKRRRILGSEGVPAVITHLMRMRGLQGRWARNPCACGHRPLQGGPLGSVPGVGSQGSTPRASSQSGRAQTCWSLHHSLPWPSRTRCFPLSDHYKALQGMGGDSRGGGKVA